MLNETDSDWTHCAFHYMFAILRANPLTGEEVTHEEDSIPGLNVAISLTLCWWPVHGTEVWLEDVRAKSCAWLNHIPAISLFFLFIVNPGLPSF